MAQTLQLIDTLKRILKAHGLTYADVAQHLDLSEANVKRLFAKRRFTLERLDQVCQLMELEISDLVQEMNERTGAMAISELSLDQEAEIAGNLELLLVTVCVLNRWTLDEIIARFHITEHRCIQHLAKLDRLRLIEMLPKNRVKLLIARNFKWQENGPIQRFFQEKIEAEFFASRFDHANERLIVMNGMLAESSNQVFQRKMEHLAREFDELNDDDAKLPLDDRDGTTLVIAMRPWSYGLFDDLRKAEAKNPRNRRNSS
ncbi:MAG: helix-turn-helix transcriptional regulator [Candidatus Thiodiazotropha lotti]|uniref:Helix-turn-helix transcriptional regulator n=1 Tax=Candidatus Thiodiazotropha lotti TaxID=2792787 RepID=A0A9E4K2X0_9GAMM|nr:helix-turn-helix transcriptional regulator [Candidatus Thiodiazotropha lotti]ODB92998.1 transcriptional regulator [Candidatus Thiodiazotropha endoloripes]MCG7921624.1 helix-turn-helix transcriptional regulator [Candidatus Thiodiazotropha lotti]MCG7937988.1 helix-turn-helix transcriptional regulator [Candidatus Thiodiazotropha lotti]MCG7989819.1 helix-turn-helix transcriptional regulator [Candidatus Thiodiazotropha lotti]